MMTTPSGCPGTFMSSARPDRCSSLRASNWTTPLFEPEPVPGTCTSVTLTKFPFGRSPSRPIVIGLLGTSWPVAMSTAWSCWT